MTQPIIDHRSTLLHQFAALKEFPMFLWMERTVENSPWHREPNVLIHTQMVVDEYVRMTDEACTTEQRSWSRADYLGGVACVFHDTGKPEAEVEKFTEARGKYRSYGGHEILSARKFESYAAERFPMFSAYEISMVTFLIEHHMPWSIENEEKLQVIAQTAKMYGAQTFSRALLADQSGRTSDAKEVNYTACIAWMDKFMKIVDHYNDDWLNRPDLRVENQTPFYMPIAPSGAGKSTYLTKLKQQHPDLVVFSLDALRHEFYDPVDYAKAYQGSVDDKSFEARANARFFAMVKEHKPMYIDNTNLSAKRRKFYLQTAKKHAYQTTAVLMPVALNVLLERQHSRKDKTVPEAAVKQQYKSLQTPLKGEFNNIVFSDHNLKRPGA